jgi:hypothetical protein
MKSNHYTEKDIQDYAAGMYEGNLPAFEKYLKENPLIASQVKSYQKLYSELKEEEVSVLPFNLADRVMSKIHAKEVVKSPFPVIPLVMIILLSIIGMYVVVKYIDFIGDLSSMLKPGLTILTVVIMILFLTAFCYVELKQMEKRMKLE